MGKIMLNEISYSGGGGGNADIVHLTQAEYDALPSSKLIDDKVYMITDVNGDGSQFQPVIYSEDEREIGVWVDGKPLYEKVFIASSPISISGSGWVATSFAINSENIVSATLIDPNGNTCGELPVANINGYINIHSSFPANVKTIILQYTKTTDQAGSGTWTPQGVPAVYYSTDEQVVGTWIDGSTIYEKTFTNLSQSTSGTSWISLSQIDASDWEQLIDLKIYGTNNSGIYIGMALAEFSLDDNSPTHPSMSLCGSFDRTITKAICRYTKTQGGA